MNNFVTIVIPSYKSRELVLSHIKKISIKIRIIIVENSSDDKLKKDVEKKYKNVKVFLQKNIGYGCAINYGAKFVKTKFFFVINPDTKIYKNTISNLVSVAKKIKYFGALSPIQIKHRNQINKKVTFVMQKVLNGGAMFFDTKIFKKIKGFDKNIFLYYEENDYFHKCNQLNLKLYSINKSFFYHSLKGDSSSAIFKGIKEKNYAYLISGWHGQWSKFYYLKKYNGFIYSFLKCAPNLIINLIQLLIKLLTFSPKTKYVYFKIEGLLSSILGFPSFKRSKYDRF